MTPDEQAMLFQIQHALAEITAWIQSKKVQQLSMPLDEASKEVLGLYAPRGLAVSALTKVYNGSVSGSSCTITAPNAYAGAVVLTIDGRRHEIPYLS